LFRSSDGKSGIVGSGSVLGVVFISFGLIVCLGSGFVSSGLDLNFLVAMITPKIRKIINSPIPP